MATSKLTALLLEAYMPKHFEEHSPRLPVKMKPLSQLPYTHKASRPSAKLVMVGNCQAIEIQNEYSSIDCEDYQMSAWVSLFDALPSSSEVETRFDLNALIEGFWPAVGIDHFRLRLLKSRWEWENSDSNDGSSAHDGSIEPERCCQARLGVFEQVKHGEEVYSDILLGPRILYKVENSKKPESEQEFAAIEAMISGLSRILGQLTPTTKKRIAEETYSGSTSPGKKRRTGNGTDETILID